MKFNQPNTLSIDDFIGPIMVRFGIDPSRAGAFSVAFDVSKLLPAVADRNSFWKALGIIRPPAPQKEGLSISYRAPLSPYDGFQPVEIWADFSNETEALRVRVLIDDDTAPVILARIVR